MIERYKKDKKLIDLDIFSEYHSKMTDWEAQADQLHEKLF